MVVTFIVAVVAGLIAALCRTEIEAWLPKWAEAARKRAVKTLPDRLRDRYDEEWEAYLLDTPGPISKLVCAIGFMVAAKRIEVRSSTRAWARAWCAANAAVFAKMGRLTSKATRALIGKRYVPNLVQRTVFALGFKAFLNSILLSVRWSSEEIRYADGPEHRAEMLSRFKNSCDAIEGSLNSLQKRFQERIDEKEKTSPSSV
jgi:hypothetical protein